MTTWKAQGIIRDVHSLLDHIFQDVFISISEIFLLSLLIKTFRLAFCFLMFLTILVSISQFNRQKYKGKYPIINFYSTSDYFWLVEVLCDTFYSLISAIMKVQTNSISKLTLLQDHQLPNHDIDHIVFLRIWMSRICLSVRWPISWFASAWWFIPSLFCLTFIL